ncbi:MAG: GNAT family N-acetyltransferase [Planctomycetes bacterium]|nr:GNAT family N-acetyltransferase [Planctomycetota bacterium]
MTGIELRCADHDDRDAVAALIHASTNGWYAAHGKPAIFPGPPADCALIFDVYEALDPGRCLLAEDAVTRALLGSCFWHPRSTHVSLGIMNVAPVAFGRGVARRLLDAVVARAEERGLPVRLVSSAQNLDSFSLYNRAGFVPIAVFQDIAVPVPAAGLDGRPAAAAHVRPATADDVDTMAALELELLGIERRGDLAHLVANRERIWSARVLDAPAGGLRGFLCASDHPASAMLGPGCARDTAAAIALLAAELDARWRGRQPIVLAPAAQPDLLAWLYARGGRNVELHLAQVRGAASALRGVALPTFLPESA